MATPTAEKCKSPNEMMLLGLVMCDFVRNRGALEALVLAHYATEPHEVREFLEELSQRDDVPHALMSYFYNFSRRIGPKPKPKP